MNNWREILGVITMFGAIAGMISLANHFLPPSPMSCEEMTQYIENVTIDSGIKEKPAWLTCERSASRESN
jgi:hypothetical protein